MPVRRVGLRGLLGAALSVAVMVPWSAQISAGVPRIDAIAPARGPVGGGTRVTVNGVGFGLAGTAVLVDGQPAEALEIVSDGELRFTTRPHANGFAGIRVETSGGVAFSEFLFVPPALGNIPVGAITTIAGTGKYLAEGRVATEAPIYAADFATGPDGLVYFSDPQAGVVRRITAAGRLETYAGRGADFAAGDIGDGGPARDATLISPVGIAFDRRGALLIADAFNHRIRRVDPTTRLIGTVAGSGPVGTCCLPAGTGFAGDGGPATSARLNQPTSLAVADDGTLYVLDTLNFRVRRLGPDGIISTVAGVGQRGFSGDGGPALDARLNTWSNADNGTIALDPEGRLVIDDILNGRIRRVDFATGVIATVAGGGTQAEASQATQLSLSNALGFGVDRNGDYIVGDSQRLRRIRPLGAVSTLLGQSQSGWSPDGTPASEVRLTNVGRLRVDDRGQPWFLEFGTKRLRRYDATTRTVSTVAGLTPRWLGDSGDPFELLLDTVRTVVATADGALVFGSDPRLFKLDADGAMRVLAGSDLVCPTCRRGEPLPATAGGFLATGLAIGSDGSVYGSARGIKRLRLDGFVVPVTQPEHGFSGDGGPASEARLDNPMGLLFDGAGNLYVADTYNHRVRRIDAATGIITTVAGTAPDHTPDVMVPQPAGGDGGPATAATFSGPQFLAFDGDGRLYVGDTGNTVRRFVVGGNIETVVRGCNGPLTSDAFGAVHALCGESIRRIDGIDRTTLVVRLGPSGMGGDGGSAELAPHGFIGGMAFTRDGNLVIADTGNRRIRAIRLR